MPHTIEPATSGRAKCRGCGSQIAKGELRLGERHANPFADDGEMTLWFHLVCGAYKRPEPLLVALEANAETIERAAWLTIEARKSLEYRRLPRVDGAERAPTGRAACRSCREKIDKGSWRIRLVLFEEDRFAPGGFIHVACAPSYFATTDVLTRIQQFSGDLETADQTELEELLGAPSGPDAGT